MKSSPLEDAVDILDDILDDHREYDLQYVLDVTFIRNALVAILAGRKQFIPPSAIPGRWARDPRETGI
jgi:hypothetical protein